MSLSPTRGAWSTGASTPSSPSCGAGFCSMSLVMRKQTSSPKTLRSEWIACRQPRVNRPSRCERATSCWSAPDGDATGTTRSSTSTECDPPGVNLEAAEWLSALGVFAGGSDTIAFELVPSKSMPVHVHLLVESGIHIIEALNLEELSQNEQWRFVLVAVPMKIVGGTGSPIRPIALV